MQRKADLDLRRGWPAFLIAIASAGLCSVLLWASPLGQRLEAHLGLELAFRIRGDRPPAPEVAYVAISHATARALGQESIYDLDEWDRTLFADVVDRLADNGVSVIIFDVLFARAGTAADQALASAIRGAGNVVLLSWVGQSRQTGPQDDGVRLNIDRLQEPAGIFLEAARAAAPMLLRKGIRMARFDTFPNVAGRAMPSIPTVALYLHRQHEVQRLLERCPDLRPDPRAGAGSTAQAALGREISALRSALLASGTGPAAAALSADCVDARTGTIACLLGGDSGRYFNFYGRPGTLAGPQLHQLFGPDADTLAASLRGKIVFIGIADNAAVNPPDSFDIALGGKAISGVELATTAVANLLHNDDLKKIRPAHGALLMLVFGTLAGVLFFLLPRRIALIAVLVCGAVYAAAAWHLFSRVQLWPPLIVPLFLQMPLTIALGWRFKLAESEKLTSTLKRFLSRWLRDKITRHAPITTEAELLYGVCLHSDVEGYTRLSERLAQNPLLLKTLEREYWRLVDEQIVAGRGERLEISGDGMTCLWTAPEADKDVVARACRTALDMQQAIDRFNLQHADTPFHTRIGIHAGKVALGLIGGEAQYTLAVGGDVASTAARLENDINKLLRTRLLVSEAVHPGIDFAPTRKVGTFVARGKTRPIVAYEVLAADQRLALDGAGFAQALAAFEAGHWDSARAHFRAFDERFPHDGPTSFYLRLLDRYAAGHRQPPSGPTPGTIDLNEKWILTELGD